MKLRDKILYMSFGAGLVVLGIVLNILVTDAEAQSIEDITTLKTVVCESLFIVDKNMRPRGGLH